MSGAPPGLLPVFLSWVERFGWLAGDQVDPAVVAERDVERVGTGTADEEEDEVGARGLGAEQDGCRSLCRCRVRTRPAAEREGRGPQRWAQELVDDGRGAKVCRAAFWPL